MGVWYKIMFSKNSVINTVIVLSILFVIVRFVIHSTVFMGWDFRNNLWAPAYLLVNHQSPYKIDVLFDVGNAVWMPMVIGSFFPLGFFSLQQASNSWLIFSSLGLLSIVWLSSGFRRPPLPLFIIAATMSFLFPPSITHLLLGQISILVTLIFVAVIVWYEKMPTFLVSFLVAIALSKPQLAILVLPGFALYKFKKDGGTRSVILFTVLLLTCILILTAPLFWAYSNWYEDFAMELQQNPHWAHPSSLSALQNLTPDFGSIIWGILATILFSLNIWLWSVLPRQSAILWSLALTPLITPYVWTWDFVMMLPLFASSLFQVRVKAALGTLILGYISCWMLIVKMKFGNNYNDNSYWWVPWFFVAVIICGKVIDQLIRHRRIWAMPLTRL